MTRTEPMHRYHKKPAIVLAGLTLALALALGAQQTRAGTLAELTIRDLDTGQELPQYHHQGKHYIAGEPGHRYRVELRNRTEQRVLAVTSVDGVNVITGQNAAYGQSGYVLPAHDRVEVSGWRKNLGQVSEFYFTYPSNSYAARTGRHGDIGVIGTAIFREQRPVAIVRPYEKQKLGDHRYRPDSETARAGASSDLGTGHGDRRNAPAEYTDFKRESTPSEVLVIYYATRENLQRRGILPTYTPPQKPGQPNPFPQNSGFAPDPR